MGSCGCIVTHCSGATLYLNQVSHNCTVVNFEAITVFVYDVRCERRIDLQG